MVSTYLSPTGVLNPSGFLKAGIGLIVLGLILILAAPHMPFDGRIMHVLAMLLAFPWICIWAKRLRYGGTSPALMLAYMGLYAILFLVFYLISFFMLSGSEMSGIMGQVMSQEITQAEAQQLMSETIDPKVFIRNIIGSGVLASLIALFIGNMATPKTGATV